jgi:hypothetical protein
MSADRTTRGEGEIKEVASLLKIVLPTTRLAATLELGGRQLKGVATQPLTLPDAYPNGLVVASAYPGSKA